MCEVAQGGAVIVAAFSLGDPIRLSPSGLPLHQQGESFEPVDPSCHYSLLRISGVPETSNHVAGAAEQLTAPQ